MVWGDRPEELEPVRRASKGESGSADGGGDNTGGFLRNCIDAVRGVQPSRLSLCLSRQAVHRLRRCCACEP
eukprot:3710002-Rhodomonas_salina.2